MNFYEATVKFKQLKIKEFDECRALFAPTEEKNEYSV